MPTPRQPSNPEPETNPERGSNPGSIAASGVRRFLLPKQTREDCLQLPPEPRSARAAREFVRGTCTRWELEPVLEPALLVVSELVTNAVLHAGTLVAMRLRARTDHLLVEVEDEDSRPPVLQHNDRHAVSGRGLILIDALSRRWGSQPCPLGKVVWAELALSR